MRILLVVLLSVLPCLVFAQKYKIKVKDKGKESEFAVDSIPESTYLSEKVKKLSIKREKGMNEDKNKAKEKHTVQVGEEEHTFLADGAYHDIEFTHDIRGLVVYILDEKRQVQGKPFILKKPK